jgi:sugar (pentulose or hexulose) kinase
MDAGCIAVLDVGKTVAKLSLWHGDGTVLERHERRNERVYVNGNVCLDARGIERWLLERLADLAHYDIDVIIPTAHGAAAALVRNEELVGAPLDYENPISPGTRERYDARRDPFSLTGSPALPNGLNLGVQLAWLQEHATGALDDGATIIPWPQYWAWLLCGTAAAELTSLGCHTDLWNPYERRPSPLALLQGWDRSIAPLRRADECLGTLRLEIAAKTGLSPDTKILCGMHASNAALNAARSFAEIDDREFTVLSTGTWFVAMRSPKDLCAGAPTLAERRDCLINVDWHGGLVPSARFMGGREIELLLAGSSRGIECFADQPAMLAAVHDVVAQEIMIEPTQTPGVGPFPRSRGGWRGQPASADAKRAAIALYAALNADAMFQLLGTRECILIEGRFATSQVMVRTLAALRPDCHVFVSYLADAVPMGALRLALPELRPPRQLALIAPLTIDLKPYRDRWRSLADPLNSA